eukprot:g4447.t1
MRVKPNDDYLSYCSSSEDDYSVSAEDGEQATIFTPLDFDDALHDADGDAKGARWVKMIEESIDYEEYRENEKFRAYMAICPYDERSTSLVKRMYKIIATCSVKVISSFLGIVDCPVNERTQTTAEAYAHNILSRGNVGGRVNDNFRTNESFLRRQVGFLEFMEENDGLKSSFEDLAAIVKRTKDELKSFTWTPVTAISHSFVSEAAAINYIEHLDRAKFEKHKKSFKGLKGVVNNKDLQACVFGEDGESCKKVKQRKLNGFEFIRSSDLCSYKSALAELQDAQAKFLGLEGMFTKLRSAHDFQKLTKMKLRTGKNREMMHKVDKSRNTISELPTRKQVKDLIMRWFGMKGSRRVIHNSLMNACAYLNMSAGMLRGDSLLRTTYSDLMILKHSDFAEPPTMFDFIYFVTISNESKTNRCGNLDYSTKICNEDMSLCPVLAEAILLIVRHDIFGTPIPDPEKSAILGNTNVHRCWHDDYIYADIFGNNTTEYTVCGEKISVNGSFLKKPLNGDSMARQWRQAFEEVGIASSHVLHVCRQAQSIVNSFNNVPIEETARVGRWNTQDDVLARSYAHLPSLQTLIRMCGGVSLETYLPLHLLVHPPQELLSIVLSEFQLSHKKAVEGNDPRGNAFDGGFINMCKYMRELAVVFLQCAPYLADFLNRNHIIFQHRVFKHELFENWSKLSRMMKRILSKLRFDAKYSIMKLRGLHFETVVNENEMQISPSSSIIEEGVYMEVQKMFGDICNYVTKMSMSSNKQFQTMTNFDQIADISETSTDGLPLCVIEEVKDRIQFEETISAVNSIKQAVMESMSIHCACKRPFKEIVLDDCKAIVDKQNAIANTQNANNNSNASNAKKAEVESMVPLGVIDKYSNSVKRVYDLWTTGNVAHRALQKICQKPLQGYTRWKNRAIQNSVQRIRCICCAIQLCILEGIEDDVVIQRFQNYKDENAYTLDKFGKMIATELNRGEVTKKRESIDAELIFKTEAYKKYDFFWKRLIHLDHDKQ